MTLIKVFLFLNVFSILILTAQVRTHNVKSIPYVNPFIGTANGGNTFPGAVVPWGMVSVSPHNSPGSPSGYIYGGKYFYGFGHTHLSGTGCSDLGSIILTATTGTVKSEPDEFKSTYSNESASPGYYKIFLDDYKINAEVTATIRCGFTRLTSSDDADINIILDVGRSLNLLGGGKVTMISEREVEGYNISGGFCGETNRQTIYFVAQFSKASKSKNIRVNKRIRDEYTVTVKDSALVCVYTFDIKKNVPLHVKVGISYTSIENARMNLNAEIPRWNFDLTRQNAEKLWEENLSRIVVEGGMPSDKIKFYTAIYHMLIHPNIISDVNGEYPLMGRTGIGKYSDGRERYTVFSLWDTYRTLHPFLTLVYPERQSDIIKTMIDMYKESGYLPKWELAGNETYIMVGDPVVPVIADSYIKGITDFDVESAFEAMLKTALLKKDEQAPPVRAGYHQLLQYGYIPFEQDRNTDWWVWGPVSTTLEYCFSDWTIAQLAKKLGKTRYFTEFSNRSLVYKNLFDSTTQFMRPRLINGLWITPFDSLATEGSGDWSGSGGPGYVEGNAWNYTWFVPHDIPGLMTLFGGGKSFVKKLLRSFENGQFTINNEPDIAYPYLFTYVKGEEHYTQSLVRRIVSKEFGIKADGLPGNDDCGTISGWLVFSALGFYPACPASDDYQIGIPLFDKVTIHLNNKYYSGKTLVIEKQGGDDVKEISRIELNGEKVSNSSIRHSELIQGGKLTFFLK